VDADGQRVADISTQVAVHRVPAVARDHGDEGHHSGSSGLPDAELIVFEHGRHGLQWQQPEKWCNVIERFLKRRVPAQHT
jgi:hypothetical protein